MRVPPSPLAALTARAQLGDRKALETLLRALQPGLRSHLLIMLREPADADDVLQETLWIIARRLSTLHDATLVRAWAYRIATRESLRFLRRTHRNQTDDLTDSDSLAFMAGEVQDQQSDIGASALDYVDQLPAKAQVIVRLRFIEGLSQQEIAEALEIPLGTVKSRLAYGLQRLRDLVGPQSRQP